MKRLLFVACFLFMASRALSQRYIWTSDSLLRSNPNYALDRYHDLLRYHDPIMYLAFPYITPLGDRSLPLEEGEGKNGFIVEGNFTYRFIIYKGKYYNYPFFQRTRFTFDADLTTRITNDRSAPLLPTNNKLGFGIDYLVAGLRNLRNEKATPVWLTFQLHHFSNGQADSFFIPGPVSRNNYKGGDFSTNYFRTFLNLSSSSMQKSIFAAKLGYQKEIDLGGVLGRSKELNQYYGFDRTIFGLQWTQKPKPKESNIRNYATPEPEDTIRLQKTRQTIVRTELQYIFDDVSKFPGTKKRRVAWQTWFTYMPSVSNEVGFLLHTYIGRDYLNIRFDDYVFIGEIGLCLKFNAR